MYRFSHLVRFMRRQYEVNDFDLNPDAEEEVFRAWAEIRPINAAELVVSDQKRSQATHRITIRCEGRAINPEWAIVDNQGLRWEIASVRDVDGNFQYLQVEAIAAPSHVGPESTR